MIALCVVLTMLANTMFYMRGIPEVGFIVRLLSEMVVSLTWFMAVMAFTVFLFTMAFWMVDADGVLGHAPYTDEAESVSALVRLWLIFQHVYRMGFIGDADYDKIQEDPILVVLFILTTFVLTIIMLNALIAIMSNRFVEVEQNVQVEMLRSKWNMLGERSDIIPRLHLAVQWCFRLLRRCIPRCCACCSRTRVH